MRKIRALVVTLAWATLAMFPGPSGAAPEGPPGLPFIEDFTDLTLRDATATNANWSSDEQALLLAWRQSRYNAFGLGLAGADIGAEARPTYSVALGDVDGDGDLDLVAGNWGYPNQLYLNNGTADPFAGVTSTGITADVRTTWSLALGDLDRDGDLDLVTGNVNQANRLYLNNGTADPFNGVTGTDITADAHETRSVALGDLDADGDLDLVAGNYYTPSRLYLNNGTADPFAGVTGTELASVALLTYSVALGDVDADGDLDLVTGNLGQAIRQFLNNGTADPFAGVTALVFGSPRSTRSVALGDMDADGDLDVITGNDEHANQLHLNNGTADPFNGVTGTDITADIHATRSLALGDLDGDGDLDLVAGNVNQANRLYLNNGTADPFAEVTGTDVTADVRNTYSVALADVNRDGGLDFVAGNWIQPSRLYLSNGVLGPLAEAGARDITADAHQTQALALGDVDRDGDMDVVAGNSTTPNRLYLNNGTADPFAGVTGTDITSDQRGTLAIALGDLDADGDLDLVAGNDPGSRLYLNNGTADPFGGVTGTDITADAYETLSVALGDVDGDGDLDLVGGNVGQPNRLYLNNGTAGPFDGVTGTDISSDSFVTRAVALGDMDGDGDLDLVAGHSDHAPRLHLNNGTADPFASVAGTNITSDAHQSFSIALGDVDRDGDLDLVAGNYGQPNRLYQNNGTSTPFAGVTGTDITGDARNTASVALGDVDADGDLDLVAGGDNPPGQTVRLYLNGGSADPFAGVAGLDVTAETHVTLAVALADVDGDGGLDVVSGNNAQPNRLYLSSSTPAPFTGVTGTDVTADAYPTESVALGDVDRDGDLDLVAGFYNQANHLYLNNGTASPFAGVTGTDVTADVRITRSAALGDVDADGDLDLVAGNYGINRLYLNNGTADPFAGVTGTDITADGHNTESVALGDVDRDGDLDLVAGNFGVANRLYLNNGTAAPFAGVTGTDITGDWHSTLAVALGDVESDGDLDLVAGNTGFGQPNRLYLNNGTTAPFAGVTGTNITADAYNTWWVETGDVDRDGDLDVVTGNNGYPNRLYLNNGTADPFAGVTGAYITGDVLDTRSVALGDVDRDGDLDLVAGNLGYPNRLYLNNGTASPFAGVTGTDITSDAHSTLSVALGDLDADGNLDVIAGNVDQPNRLYQRMRYYDTGHGRARSLRVDTETANIPNARLTATATLLPNTGVAYYLSNNGGLKWYQVRSGVTFVFPTASADLRWRAELTSLSPARSPRLDQLQIDSAPCDLVPAGIAIAGGKVQLNWTPVIPLASYDVYRDQSPYFTPADPPYAAGVTSPWTDTAGTNVGDWTENYTYLLRGPGCAEPSSLRVGEFDFELVPGQ